jgi:hypothetical protein
MSFPELAGLDVAEAKRLRVEVQKRVTRRPLMLLGLFATVIGTAIILLYTPIGGIFGLIISGALIGGSAAAYLKFVITPQMRKELQNMGYHKK